MVTCTPEGRSVRLRPVSVPGHHTERCLPYGLTNAMSEYARLKQHLFAEQDYELHFLVLPRLASHHVVNMVGIKELPASSDKTFPIEGYTTSCYSTGSNRSSSTELQRPFSNQEDHDMDWQACPLGFPCFPVFPPRRGDIINHISNNKPMVDGETDEQQQEHEGRNADHAQR